MYSVHFVGEAGQDDGGFQENFIQVCLHRYCEHLMAFDTVIFHDPSDVTLTLLLLLLLLPFKQIFLVLRFSYFSHDFTQLFRK